MVVWHKVRYIFSLTSLSVVSWNAFSLAYYDIWPPTCLCSLLLESNRRNTRSPNKGCIIIHDNSCVKQTKWPSHAILEYVWCKVRNYNVQSEHKSEKNTRLSCLFKFPSLSLHLYSQTRWREYANSDIEIKGEIFTTEMHDLPHIYLIYSPWQLN